MLAPPPALLPEQASREGARGAPRLVFHGSIRWGRVTPPAPGLATPAPVAAQEAHVRNNKSAFKAHRRQLELEQYAWCHRRAPTESEARLWEELRGKRLGVQFRRQGPIAGCFI